MMMRIVFVFLLLSCSSFLFATDYYVGGAGASDSNAGTAAAPFATIQKAASVAANGDVVKIRGGVYRETVTPTNSGVTFVADGGTVVISGLNTVGTAWTVHSGNIYKTTINLPNPNNYSEFNGTAGGGFMDATNTTILANQIFKDGTMMIHARWPNISTPEDMFDKTKFRGRSQTSGWTNDNITDSGIGALGLNLAGAHVWMNGWFVSQTRIISSSNGNQISFPTTTTAQQPKFGKHYYITNHLGLIDSDKEWHYAGGTLYFRQAGGGSPTGVEYKARNWGFDLRGKSNVTIQGLQFIGCDPVHSNTSSNNLVVDNIRAKYMNHTFINSAQNSGGDARTASMVGTKLIGSNNIVKNSEFKYSGAQGIWLGNNSRAENNKLEYIGYDGMWSSAFNCWYSSSGQTITNNTTAYTSRGAVELGTPPHLNHQNVTISFNDFTQFNRLSIDGGAIYAGQQSDLTGTRIHHNWFHDSGVIAIETPLDGVQINGVYLDQAAGPVTMDHNVHWNGGPGTYSADFYAEISNHARNSGGHKLYNNTFGNTGQYASYVTYITSTADVQRNNIYRANLNINHGASAGNVANVLLQGVDPKFLGTGGAGLNYRLQDTSPARNTGVVIPGITDGSVGAPDMGAYEVGGTDWVAGYKPVTASPTNSSPTVGLTAPAANATFVQGAAINITANAADSDGSIARVEFYDGATKIGEDLTAPYAFSWSTGAAGAHNITARATDNLNATTTSAAVAITITGAAVNTNPTVVVTAPANNASVVSGTVVNITVTAADADGTVAKVEFFDGASKLGEDVSSPYTLAWSNAGVGAHAITAKATDNLAGSATSAAVTLTVTPNVASPTNTPPVVSITAPGSGATFNFGDAINVTATATDANGTISKVEFFDGATKLGEDLTSPYSYAWSTATSGVHSLTAKATDNANVSSSSVEVSITVSAGNALQPPVVSAGDDVNVTLPDNTATLSSVANGPTTGFTYAWAQISGPSASLSNTTTPVLAISALNVGTYVFELTVTDGNGISSKDQVTVIVSGQSVAQTTIPRFFTPNSDGQNDTWNLPEAFTTEPTQLTVFNALGQKVHEVATYSTGWDGKSNGAPLQEDAYYYVIKRPTGAVLQGAVRIIR